MNSMVRLRSTQKTKGLLAWSIVPMCLFLVFLGIRVPNLTSLHASPKPTPRAVIETASKSSKPALAKQVIAIELFNCVPELLAPRLYPSRFLVSTYQFTSTAPPQIAARAPPVIAS